MVTTRSAPAPAGTLTTGAPENILRWCEEQRFTGSLGYVQNGARAEMTLVAGEVETNGADDPMAAALDRFLVLSEGSYTLTQRLPVIDGAKVRSATELSGDLALRSPAELLHWCEAVGLTGRLDLDFVGGDSTNPRGCTAVYERGELVSLTLDGRDDVEVATIFEWTTGGWKVVALPLLERSSAPPVTTPSPEGGVLLRTVEVALADIIARRDQSLGPPRRAPSLRPPPAHPGTEADVVKIPPAPKVPRSPMPPKAKSDAPAADAQRGPESHASPTDTTIKVYFVKVRNHAALSLPEAVDAAAASMTPGRHRAVEKPAPPSMGVELALWGVLIAAGLIAGVHLAGLLSRG